jgi:hypothetical protein
MLSVSAGIREFDLLMRCCILECLVSGSDSMATLYVEMNVTSHMHAKGCWVCSYFIVHMVA